MKKILVVTFIRAINYGAVLQSYATNVMLKKLRTTPVFLDIAEDYPLFFNIFKFKSLKEKLFWCRENFFIFLKLSKILSKRNAFKEFIKNNFQMTVRYPNAEAVMKNPPKADIYMTGSDQMFNITKCVNPAFFLDFADEDSVRFSYATSMGNFDYNENNKEKIYDKLTKYKHLSVREYQAKEYLNSMGLDVSQHMDPTLLLSGDEWFELIKSQKQLIEGNYILVYELLSNDLTYKVVEELKKQTGFKIVSIATSSFLKNSSDIILHNVGPLEFLNLFKYASQVVTTSFHGTCFSVIFKKPFYSIVEENEKRITSLAELLNLKERVLVDTIKLTDSQIDWDFCDKVVEDEKLKSIEYLKKCIDGGA